MKNACNILTGKPEGLENPGIGGSIILELILGK
jgi:hypothetical protein